MDITKDLMFLSKAKVTEFFNQHIVEAYEIIKQTYLDFANGKSKNPPSSFLWYDNDTNSRIIGLAACIGDKKTYPGIKWIASCPHNIDNGIPRASAVIILNDFVTGFPVAIIEGATISALRTALSAILALEHLHQSKYIANLGIVGGGNLAIMFLQCLNLLGWKVDNCSVYDKRSNQARDMIEKLSGMTKIDYNKNCDQVLKQSEVVLLTTTAVEPYITDPNLFKSNAIILNLSLRDLSPQVILSAYNIVDDIEHVLTANTSPHLAYLLSGNKDFITGNIMQLVLMKIKVANDKPKIFSPMGMGILDIALANLILATVVNARHDNHLIIKEFF